MEERVLEVEQWVNENYEDHPDSSKIPKHDRTSWLTLYVLT